DRWREMAFGTLDGRRVGEVVVGLVARWADDIHHAPDGGESMAAVHDRVGEAWADVLGSRTAGATVVVTHATPIKSAVIHALRGSPSQILSLRVDVGSVSVIGVPRPFSPVLEVFNDVSHLD
ncbi:MAG: histidine phosphatase family protein, partial [Acidimicrobiales bacterium]